MMVWHCIRGARRVRGRRSWGARVIRLNSACCRADSPARDDGAMGLSVLERDVVAAVERSRGELVDLLGALIAFDTVTHEPGAPAREEAALQAFLARRLSACGARVTVSEPDAALVAGHPMVPDGLT